jgi:hypothetical protein
METIAPIPAAFAGEMRWRATLFLGRTRKVGSTPSTSGEYASETEEQGYLHGLLLLEEDGGDLEDEARRSPSSGLPFESSADRGSGRRHESHGGRGAHDQ